jgi:hypothetical protein
VAYPAPVIKMASRRGLWLDAISSRLRRCFSI